MTRRKKNGHCDNCDRDAPTTAYSAGLRQDEMRELCEMCSRLSDGNRASNLQILQALGEVFDLLRASRERGR